MTTAELLDHPAIFVLIGAVVSFLIIGTIVSVLSIPFLGLYGCRVMLCTARQRKQDLRCNERAIDDMIDISEKQGKKVVEGSPI